MSPVDRAFVEDVIVSAQEAQCVPSVVANAGSAMMSGVPELHTVITGMGDRIRQLELALSNARHPLDRHKPLDKMLSTLDRPPAKSIPPEVLGSLSVNAAGDTIYFGPTAGPETLLSIEGASIAGLHDRAAITESFPFSSDQTPWDVDLALHQLFAHLPLEERAWRICEAYYRNGCWTGMPIMQSETVELLSLMYHDIGGEEQRQPSTLTQRMAVLYLIFALGSLVDLDLPPYNSDADHYFDLACAAMSIKPFFEHPTVVAVQALTLLACYYGHGGPNFTVEGAWSTISLASSLSQRFASLVYVIICSSPRRTTLIGKLDRESFGSKLSPELCARSRTLFWETYSIEIIYGLSVGRPTGTFLSDISCPYPPDEADDAQPFVNIFRRYRQSRWSGTKEVTAPIMETFLKTKQPSYDAILDMDQRIRKYIHSCPFESFAWLENEPPFAYIQRHLVPLYAKIMILYIHGGYFVAAMRDSPLNPLASSYSGAFIAAYLSAAGIIEANKRNFTTHPLLFTRWWGIWKSLFNAAIIVGTVAVRYPKKHHHPHAILALMTAVDLFEKGAESCRRARSGLAILHRLRDKAIAAHSACQAADYLFPPRTIDPETERDLDILAGYTPVVASKQVPRERESDPASQLPPAQGTNEVDTRQAEQDSDSYLGQYVAPASDSDMASQELQRENDRPSLYVQETNPLEAGEQALDLDSYLGQYLDVAAAFGPPGPALDSGRAYENSDAGLFFSYPPISTSDAGVGTGQDTLSWVDFLGSL
ncbi:hypothetical protein B0H13DRAFT_2462783 [Mycena leptocephala]|nr:hypothetical protein B0H13DRAFT_2462783 [Mycena leptocephala]